MEMRSGGTRCAHKDNREMRECRQGFALLRPTGSRTFLLERELAPMAASRAVVSRHAGELPPDSLIFGRSAAMQAVRSKVLKIASTSVPVLIQGDSGTGKGVLARYLHFLSPVSNAPFVKVNCAAIPGPLLESELFGYERGAFTGAQTTKPGRVELAEGGTLFLDVINEDRLSPAGKTAAPSARRAVRAHRRAGRPPSFDAHDLRHESRTSIAKWTRGASGKTFTSASMR